ncbi:MAG: hypothetical protein Q8R88_10910 [Desulfoprunum sp.]|nr:hypothetical protein [Desulfoprunum sp.]
MFAKFSFFKKKTEQISPKTQIVAGIDPELQYCPSCGDEYRADFKRCAVCQIDLISGVQKLALLQHNDRQAVNRSMEIKAEDKLITLRKGQVNDIKYFQKILADQRIPSIIGGEADACRKGCRGGPELHLQIREADGQDAMVVLAHDFKNSTALDSHDLSHIHAAFDPRAAKTACPACGSQFAPTTTTCPECGLCFG